ncbi:MAG: L-threonylcarbamoyladenylate synthase, partial [Magnetovibrio sp.]|nr:L-threonylcarbamoyladenylate synthase [Magnetovibrio sp.]
MNGPDQIVAADAAGVARAAETVRRGGLVAFPPETVYGLGADATDERAVAAIFKAKGRPRFNPLIVHVPDLAAAERLAAFDARARALAERFWPGALTLVLPRRADAGLSLLVSAGLETVAVRVPSHPVAAALLRAAERPIAAPSANRSGAVSPTEAGHVARSLGSAADGGPDLILDGGACPLGLESSVVDLSTPAPALLRPGGVTLEALEAAAGPLAIAADDDTAPKSPGMLSRHYAPATPLRLGARTADAGEVLLGFGPGAAGAALNLSPAGDLDEAAATRCAMLRRLDDARHDGIAVMAV